VIVRHAGPGGNKLDIAAQPLTWVALLLGYALGSIPFGLILTRLAGTEDLRSIGSGNIGATNVLRTGRKGLAAATLLLDALKGTAACLIGARLGGDAAALAGLAGLGAFLGHLYPAWLKFKGGKGVATYIGVLLGLMPLAALAFAVIWLIVAFISRYSSLSALVASAAMPVVAWAAGEPRTALLLIMLSVLVFWKHRPNISRLLAGTEGRIGEKV
jgi:acyl phosphate:glycerol-3-phosphate acyltransferase